MTAKPRILVVAHDALVAEFLLDLLPARGYATERVSTHEGAMDTLAVNSFDLVISEDSPPACDATALASWMHEALADLDLVLVTQDATVPMNGVEVRSYDVLSLPFSSAEVVLQTVSRALDKRAVKLENRRLAGYLAQADAQLDGVNLELAALAGERAIQGENLSAATAHIDTLNGKLSHLLVERERQLRYLAEANTQVDQMNRELARLITQRNRQLDYLAQANTQIEEMNSRLEAHVAERTRVLEEANARLEELTLTDDVTGLYNQRWLRSRLGEEYNRAKRHDQDLAVLMLDVDNFKLVNDNHDHLFGSAVLRRVGELLRTAVRGIDIAVRYGGDEFVVLLPQTSLPGAVAVAERLRVSVAKTDVGDPGRPYCVTLSIGVAGLRESSATNAEELLQAADRALYCAKDNGRNRVAAMNGIHPVTVVG